MTPPSASPAPVVRLSRAGRVSRGLAAPALLGLAAMLGVLATAGPGGPIPAAAEGPGSTLDEAFNVETGVYLVRSIREFGLASLHPETIREIWGGPDYNPDHPPLGRLALGLSHEWLAPARTERVLDAAARPATAAAFGLTVFLAALTAGRWFGLAGAVGAGAAVVLMPRLFAHAHLASLETFIGLTYAACILWIAERWEPTTNASTTTTTSASTSVAAAGLMPTGTSGSGRLDRSRTSPGMGAVIVAGVLWGLALLTKIQAILLAPAVAVWGLFRFRHRAVLPGAAFGAMGVLVFFLGWPWLRLDPWQHFVEYLARTTERQTLYCFYAGVRWADVDVPWHFPWVMFLTTVPIGLQALGGWGVWCSLRGARTASEGSPGDADLLQHRSRMALVLLAILSPLVVFSLPSIRVYDGERLYAVAFPLWGVVIGAGFADVWRRLLAIGRYQGLSSPAARSAGAVLLGVFLALQGVDLVRLHPCQLSYYNLLVGGLPGADRLGFERSYWADGLTESFQREIAAAVPAGARIDVAPVLHPLYLGHLEAQCPVLREARVTLAPYDHARGGGSRYVLMFHRRADPWSSLLPPPEGTKVLCELQRRGVPLATLFELPAS